MVHIIIMNIVYRKAAVVDVDMLVEMRMSMLSEMHEPAEALARVLRNNTREYFLTALEDGSFSMFVALHDNRIVAMGGISYFRFPPNDWAYMGNTAYISNMFTLREYRKNGFATVILSMIMEEATRKGTERIILNPTETGRALYEKHGFKEWSGAMAFFPKSP